MKYNGHFLTLFLTALVFLISQRALSTEPAAVDAKVEDKNISGNQTDQWKKLQLELSEKKGKVDAQKKIVEELIIVSKNESTHFSQDQLQQLKEQHAKLDKMTNDYNELMRKFETRFPEKGITEGRQYFRIDSLTLEQIENSLTVAGRMKQINQKIRTQYNKPVSDDSSTVVFDPKKHKKPEVTDQIILVK